MTRKYPKQITPGLAPGSSARLDAEAERTGLTPSTLIRQALEKIYPTAGRRPPPPRIASSGKALAVVQRVSSISAATLDQIECARQRNRLRSRTEVIRHAIERTYPPD